MLLRRPQQQAPRQLPLKHECEPSLPRLRRRSSRCVPSARNTTSRWLSDLTTTIFCVSIAYKGDSSVYNAAGPHQHRNLSTVYTEHLDLHSGNRPPLIAVWVHLSSQLNQQLDEGWLAVDGDEAWPLADISNEEFHDAFHEALQLVPHKTRYAHPLPIHDTQALTTSG